MLLGKWMESSEESSGPVFVCGVGCGPLVAAPALPETLVCKSCAASCRAAAGSRAPGRRAVVPAGRHRQPAARRCACTVPMCSAISSSARARSPFSSAATICTWSSHDWAGVVRRLVQHGDQRGARREVAQRVGQQRCCPGIRPGTRGSRRAGSCACPHRCPCMAAFSRAQVCLEVTLERELVHRLSGCGSGPSR